MNDEQVIFKVSCGTFQLSVRQAAVTGLIRLPDCTEVTPLPSPGTFCAKALSALQEYFDGKRKDFPEFPISYHGTAFQENVWRAITRIPWGAYKTYGQIAAEIGCPGGARAVGQAVHRNPILILIPCHRILAANGLGGFGSGIDLKLQLLHLEHIHY